ncbi:MAG: hypothetical protein A3A94_00105 [Candidatus Portnoybacteria bacterium RIFCSPLOWO2_01_FULL_43_11]|uniref:Transglutaminase-like domain-containing protein n=3 Tax=Bacteria candidate phyla TaxID=1783234 RepID=A0A1G2FMR0_9BACT|nr:MAG: hypothetical protein A2713_00720 [candidate division WWE3 bacterium RIFCSPHIGHO2_01_FULL_35_17]OGZ38303.1 MAG: hypothetical protein A3A94_00105 [Candidatus Portnoybacteria bacterium RIFCSPLOWO2_01_FULL_43_11]OGZ39082.1 MAG: hypothetical protein A3E90_00780 [Candidatus Portnoybacteria bacterium RIFCSPHIGHO2_12_FULL_40_11]
MNQSLTQYLKSGHQTKITPEIKKIANSFTKDGFDLIFEILAWLHKNLRAEDNPEIKDKLFRKRTAQEIIKSGFVTGCTDWALAFIILARVKKIPTRYVEIIRRRWLEEGKNDFIEGHIFAEVYLNNHWYIIDPEEASIKDWYNRWIIFRRGLDSWDIGIRNFKDLKEQFLEFRAEYKSQLK